MFVDDAAPTHTIFRETPGSNVGGSCQTPEECFSLFFSDDVWQFLVDNTNEYAAHKIGAMQVSMKLGIKPIKL